MLNFESLKKEIISANLCTYCGTCVGICPVQTLSPLNETIVNSHDACISCGRCLSSCPGKYFDFQKYTKAGQKNHIYVGNFENIYTGHSNNSLTREQGSSGGCVTELLLHLLRTNKVDSVIVTTNTDHGPAPIITSDEKEIIRAAQSKYCLSPTNIILNAVLKSGKRFAYVGLPCQIQGLRKAMDVTPALKSKIPYIIGIFCGFNMTINATHFLVKKSKIVPTDVQEISYRKKLNGTTGFFIRGSQKNFFVEKHGYTFLNLFYSPKRCLKCYDYTAEFADIAFGDAWEKGLGWSRIISRTAETDQLLHDMAQAGRITLTSSSVTDIANSQKSILSHKKLDFWIRKNFYKNFPEYNIPVPALNSKQKLHGNLMTFILTIAHSKVGLLLLTILPFDLLQKISKKLRK